MKMPVQTQKFNERDALEDLLPWYAAGTLNAADSLRVESALTSDPDFAHRLDIAREEMGEAVLANQMAGAPSSKALAKLIASLEKEPLCKPSFATNIFDFGGRLANWFQPKTLAWATIAGAFVIMVQAGVMSNLIGKSGQVYETASKSQPSTVQAGTILLVGFAPEATAAQITSVLGELKGSIVEGPKPGGMYRVKVSDIELSKTESERIIALWRIKTGVVRFVGAGQ
jgi:anti-sigma factor RsiW